MLDESKNSICAEKTSEDDIENKDNANRAIISVMSDGCVMCNDDADEYVKIIDECSSDIRKPADIIDFDNVLALRSRYVPYKRHKWNARRIAAVAAAAVAAIVFALPSIAFAASDRNAVDTGISFEQIVQAIRDASTEDDDGAFNTVGYEEVPDRVARDVNGTPISTNSKLEGHMDAAMYLDELATLRSGVSGETDTVVSELGEYVNDDAKAVLTSSEDGMRNAMTIASYNESKTTFDAEAKECRDAKAEAERSDAEEAARKAAAAAAAATMARQQDAVYSSRYNGGYSSSSGSSGCSSSWSPNYVTAYGSQASIDAGRTYLTEYAPGYFAGHRHFSVGQSIASHPQYVTVNGQKYQYAGTQNFANGSSLSAATGWAGTGSGNIAFQTCNNDGATVQVNKYVPVG